MIFIQVCTWLEISNMHAVETILLPNYEIKNGPRKEGEE